MTACRGRARGGRSFYTDEVCGRPYWTFRTEGVPRVARSMVHLADRLADTFVAGMSMAGLSMAGLSMAGLSMAGLSMAGLSMGGYGAPPLVADE